MDKGEGCTPDRSAVPSPAGLRPTPLPTFVGRGEESPRKSANQIHCGSGDDVRALASHLEVRGHTVRWSNETAEAVRFHVDDPFGNRLEMTAPA
ncbi:MAG: hypothetical protein ABIS92_10430 [Polyangia bacterium]